MFRRQFKLDFSYPQKICVVGKYEHSSNTVDKWKTDAWN